MSCSDDISLSRYFKTILNERRISSHRNATKTAIQISRLDNPSLAIMFAGLLFQYGAGNCERVYLDLKKAIQMCTTSEVAAQQMEKIQSAEDNTEDVKKFDEKKKAHRRRRFKNTPEQQQKSIDKQTKSGAEPRAGFTCKYCGRQRHVKGTDCPASGKNSSKCGKKGHFSSVCLTTKKVNHLEDLETSSEDEACLNLATVSLVDTKARQ